MKKLLIALAALVALPIAAEAADYPAPPGFEPAEQTVVYDWSGVYGGFAAGRALGKADYGVEHFDNVEVDDLDGWTFGAHVGAQKQIGIVVFGGELDGGWLGASAEKDLGGAWKGNVDTDWFVLAKAKAGIAYDRFMGYGTVGYAGVSSDVSVRDTGCGNGQCVGHRWGDDPWMNGWTFGAGADYAATDRIVVGVEWNHVMIEDVGYSDKLLGQTLDVNADYDFDLVRAKLSVKF